MEYRRVIGSFPHGVVTPPPSKSYSHRAVICAFLASLSATEESVVSNLGESDDIEATLGGIAVLGARYRLTKGELHMLPVGKPQEGMINCKESGSTLRFLLPIAACFDRENVFSGSGRLLERPLDVYEQVFGKAGVRFFREDGAIRVQGPLREGNYEIAGDVSSQFISGMLLALSLLPQDSELHLTTTLESSAYVDMTIAVMRQFGVQVIKLESGYRIPGGQCYRPCSYRVETDFSQAAFFLAAAALGRDVRCRGLNPESLQGDRAILAVLREMGAAVLREGDTVSVKAGALQAVTVDAREIPDLVPPIAALCCFCSGSSRIVNAGRLRLKESDRLHALAQELGSLGADITESGDELLIRGSDRLIGGKADAHNDHRIAMTVAVAAIRCKHEVLLSGAESVRKSYPRFWLDFSPEAESQLK